RFEAAILKPYGMVLVTGPTGSGKTNTLYSALQRINTPEVNIITAEDPVEFTLMGINQVQMREQIGLNFAASLRSFLRQDPNIILVGEIRDFETAEVAIIAAQRLVRRICSFCREPAAEVPPNVLVEAGFSDAESRTLKLFRGKGCER